MTTNQPPKLATWLLLHFACTPNNAAIVGDLEERHRQAPSGLWYWRQALRTIAVGVGREVWDRKLATVFALVMSWVMLEAMIWIAAPPAIRLQNQTFLFWGANLVTHGLMFLVDVIAATLMGIMIGFLHRWLWPDHVSAALAFILSSAMWIFGGILLWSFQHPSLVSPAFPYTIRIMGWELIFIAVVLRTCIVTPPHTHDSETTTRNSSVCL